MVDDALYVMQKQELTHLVDRDGDGRIDDYRAVAAGFQTSGNFHEFAFGLVARDGSLYGGLSACVENGGKSCAIQLPDRGTLFRFSLASGTFETVASGLRTPNGLGLGPPLPGETRPSIYVTDNQGDWLPASKLLALREGAFYGWRSPLQARRALAAPGASGALAAAERGRQLADAAALSHPGPLRRAGLLRRRLQRGAEARRAGNRERSPAGSGLPLLGRLRRSDPPHARDARWAHRRR